MGTAALRLIVVSKESRSVAWRRRLHPIREGTQRPDWESEDDWERLLVADAVPLWRRIFRAVWAPILFYLMFGALIFGTGVYEVTDNLLLLAVVSIPLLVALAALAAAMLWEFLLRPLLVKSGWITPDDT